MNIIVEKNKLTLFFSQYVSWLYGPIQTMMSFYSFRLSVPNRIFYFVASTPSEAKAWIELLQWKIVSYCCFMVLW